jgi:hypothetical protein
MEEKPLFTMRGKGGRGRIKLFQEKLEVECSCGCGRDIHIEMLTRNWRGLRNRIESLLGETRKKKKVSRKKPRVDIKQSRGALVTIESQKRRKRKKCSK